MRCRNRGTLICPIKKLKESRLEAESWDAFLSLRMQCIEGQLDWTEADRQEAIRELKEMINRRER